MGGFLDYMEEKGKYTDSKRSFWAIASRGDTWGTSRKVSDAELENKTGNIYKEWDPNVWNIEPNKYPTLRWEKTVFPDSLTTDDDTEVICL